MNAIEEALERSRGAKFWKSALQINPYSYVVKYRGQCGAKDEAEYNAQIVTGCLENGIQIVGIADHGSVQSLDSLRTELEQKEIVVFPGFEIASAEKIHMVCLFEPGTDQHRLNQILGAVFPPDPANSEPTRPSKYSCREIAGKIHEYRGSWFLAHMTGKNGLLRLNKDGDNFTDTWKDCDAVLAGQIPGSLDALSVPTEDLENATSEELVRKKYRDIIENKNPQYYRPRPVAIINAKDVCDGTDFANDAASCRIKMTEPTAEALRQAFMDPESRVRLHSDEEEERFAQIIAGAWTGGYLDGLRIHFSDNLNTLIGGRGTGKSTVVETIRYTLGLETHSQDAQSVHEEIVAENLGNGGEVELLVRSRAQLGRVFRISRRFGSPPEAKFEDGTPSSLSPSEILPEIQILGQNEILDIANDNEAVKELLHRLLPEISASTAEIRKKGKELQRNRAALRKAELHLDELAGEISRLPKIQEQIEQYKSLGLEKKLADATKLSEEQGTIEGIESYLNGLDVAYKNLEQSIQCKFDELKDDEIDKLPNKAVLLSIRSMLEMFQGLAKNDLNKLFSTLQTAKREFESEKKNWEDKKSDIEANLKTALAGLPDSAGKKGTEIGQEYLTLTGEKARIEPLKRAATVKDTEVKSLHNERFQLLSSWRDAKNKQFDDLRRGAKRLHRKHLKGKLRIEVVQWGNRSRLREFLLSLDGVGVKKLNWIDKVETLSIATLVERIREGKDSIVSEYGQYGMTPGTAEILASLSMGKVRELEEVDLPSKIELELNVSDSGEVYRQIQRLSTGQKCTAILHLLLLESHEPLLVDQPEDNLDNSFIAGRIVTELRSAKQKRQFIFSTHNANIPVFGDSEWIGALKEEDGIGTLSEDSVGSIDIENVRALVSKILEGGREAFEIRRAKYGY